MAADTSFEMPREGQRVASSAVLLVGFGTLAMVVAVLGLVWLFAGVSGGGAAMPGRPAAFSPPRLQSDPAGALRIYRRQQEAALGSYAWVDRQRGLVRIPIDRAMAMIVARGEGAFDPLALPGGTEPRR